MGMINFWKKTDQPHPTEERLGARPAVAPKAVSVDKAQLFAEQNERFRTDCSKELSTKIKEPAQQGNVYQFQGVKRTPDIGVERRSDGREKYQIHTAAEQNKQQPQLSAPQEQRAPPGRFGLDRLIDKQQNSTGRELTDKDSRDADRSMKATQSAALERESRTQSQSHSHVK